MGCYEEKQNVHNAEKTVKNTEAHKIKTRCCKMQALMFNGNAKKTGQARKGKVTPKRK